MLSLLEFGLIVQIKNEFSFHEPGFCDTEFDPTLGIELAGIFEESSHIKKLDHVLNLTLSCAVKGLFGLAGILKNVPIGR